MNTVGAGFLTAATLAILLLPRRWAVLPLLASITWMTAGQVLMVGPANMTILRIVIGVGLLRVLLRGEPVAGGTVLIDRLVVLWGVLLLLVSPFHLAGTVVFHAGMVWTEVGAYFLFRRFIQDRQDAVRSFKILLALLLPVAFLVLREKAGAGNQFALLGGVNLDALVRDGTLRASGPFAHPILAGVAGAVAMAGGLALLNRARCWGLLGCLSGAVIVYASGSSGPILMVAFVVLGLVSWLVRERMSLLRRTLVLAVLSLAVVMKAPIWFLIARIDVIGGSESWFRAQLIQSSLEHLSEWWLVGTDFTRHWMATGIHANQRHTDITNHFLSMGIKGGLPLLIVFIWVIVAGFRSVGVAIRAESPVDVRSSFFVWSLGALLFGFVANFFAITLFDQSVLLFWMTIAAIASLAHGRVPAPPAPATGEAAAPVRVRPRTPFYIQSVEAREVRRT